MHKGTTDYASIKALLSCKFNRLMTIVPFFIIIIIIIIIIVWLAPFQCIAPLATNNLQSGLSSASSVASSIHTEAYDGSLFIVAQEV